MRYDKEQEHYYQDEFVVKVYSRDKDGKQEGENALIIGLDDMSPQDVLDCLEELKSRSPHVMAGGEFDYGVEEIRLPENMFVDSDTSIERLWYVANQYGVLKEEIEDRFGEHAMNAFELWYAENFVGHNFLKDFSLNWKNAFEQSFIGLYDSTRDFVTAYFEEQEDMVPDFPSWIHIDYDKTAQSLHEMGIIYSNEDGIGIAYNNDVVYPSADTEEDCHDAFHEEVEGDADNGRRMRC